MQMHGDLQRVPADGRDDGFALRSLLYSEQQIQLNFLSSPENQIFLFGKIIERGLCGNVGLGGNFGDRDGIESPLGKKPQGRL